MNIRNENGRITKAGRVAMLAFAKRLLPKRGFVVDEPCGWLILDDLIAEFDIDPRTAKGIEAQAARLLRGEYVEAWKRGSGTAQPMVRHNYMVQPSDDEALREIGGGNASLGIRTLISERMAKQE